MRRVDSSRSWSVLLIVALLAGAALRLWQLDVQIVIDDEWHAINELLRATPANILTHLGYADYSIPLTLYYQALYRSIGLSEWGMHLPPLAAGIALLIVGPRMLERWCALPARAIWMAQVAVSPLLVYHSRVARPYALTSLLTFVAIVAARTWWLQARRRDGAVYAAATFLAGWLHPITLPFTLLPGVYFAVQGIRRLRGADPAGRAREAALAALRRLATLGVVTGVPLAIVLLPPVIVDWGVLAEKAGHDMVTPQSVYRTLLMLAGTGSPMVAGLVGLFAVAGFVQFRRRDRDVARYVATVVGIGAIIVASSGAEWIMHPLVLARYLIPALPFLLLLSAEGVAGLVGRLRHPSLEALGVAAAVTGLFAAGPIPGEWHYPNQFFGHLRYQFDYDPAHNPYVLQVPKVPAPEFYRELAKRPPGSVTLIEAPWRLESHFNALSLYQDVHHQLIRIGFTTPVCGVRDFGEYPAARTGMKMREFVHLGAVLRGDFGNADYLVMHLTPGSTAAVPPEWPDVARCLPAIAERLGTPIYRDERIVVFDLRALSPLGNSRHPVQQ